MDRDSDATLNYSSLDLIKDIFKFIKPYRGRFWLGSFIRLVGDVSWLYPAYAIASIVTFLSQYKAGQSLRNLWVILALWGLAVIVRNLSQFFAKFLGYRVAEKVAIDAGLNAVRHMFLLDMIWHERENSGNKVKRIQNASLGLNNVIRLWFDNIIEICVNFTGIIIIISRFDNTILILLIIFLVTYFSISAYMTHKAGLASYRVNAQEEESSGLTFESINNIRTVKVMAMGKQLMEILSKQADELFKRITLRVSWYRSRQVLLAVWAYGFRLAGIAIIIFGILHGHYEVGFLILFHSYFNNIWESVDELSTSTQDFVTSKFSIARMKVILNEPITIDDETGKKPFSKNWKKIILQNVSFSYGDNEVLKGLSLEITRGEKIGVVGLSGAGKSTLFKLLLKEREEFTGDILFDDVSIKNIQKIDYFSHVSVVLQDTEVFNFSLRDNIIVTNPKQQTNNRLLNTALSVAHVSDFLGKLPNGLETIIGEKGVKLSGGERQRLGIARAIFKQPQLLLMDEATSHLDIESEEKIQDSLHKFFKDVTAIVIAHRLTTIKEMDKILVIEEGKLLESGNFEELYKKRGRFFELWGKQKL